MGIRKFFGQEAEAAPDDWWAELADELGLSYRLAQGNTAVLRSGVGGIGPM